MSKWPDVRNPREMRAFAYAQAAGLRERTVPVLVARQAVFFAINNQKGSRSGLMEGYFRAARHEPVAGRGAAYNASGWPYPESSERFDYIFRTIARQHGISETLMTGTDRSWEVIRDELAARGYGMHDAGHGMGVVAVQLDRNPDLHIKEDFAVIYGVEIVPDKGRQTRFA